MVYVIFALAVAWLISLKISYYVGSAENRAALAQRWADQCARFTTRWVAWWPPERRLRREFGYVGLTDTTTDARSRYVEAVSAMEAVHRAGEASKERLAEAATRNTQSDSDADARRCAYEDDQAWAEQAGRKWDLEDEAWDENERRDASLDALRRALAGEGDVV